jgi:serine/threonine-protein kinase
MSRADADRNLLFGLLALQNGLIDQAQLVAAFQAWTLEKSRPLAEYLLSRGDLDAADRAAVESLVARHLKKHGESAERSLAALPAGTATRASLCRIADSDLDTSLALLCHGDATAVGQEDGDARTALDLARTAARTSVILSLTDPGPEPPVTRPAARLTGRAAGRYELLGEIARGGMGAVLRGRDPDLGRDLALKVLLEEHTHRPDLIDRFLEEAQICGQLQHPGVVPVYELGALPDHRPFFTMKLVKGRTLAALLDERSSPGDDLPRFLSIFEAVCQTVAYAHARGVIHRDLKPSNVMVGPFGEVQVMDWGLAKVLPGQGQAARPEPTPPAHQTVVSTARSKGDSDLSHAGSVLGTPAYMAPEQARGETERIDRRADVFALGSMLCEVLTGAPAFEGDSPLAILRAAERADSAAALKRLEQCGADEDLVALARDCLAAEPEGRPADAGVVAARLTAHLAGVQERLRDAELARAAEAARAVEAEAKAAAERRARRSTRALAVTVLLGGALAAAGWRWVELDRMHRASAALARVNAALREATRLRGAAQGADVGELAPWDAAEAAIEKARELLDEEAEPALRRHVELVAAEIHAEHARAEADAQAAHNDRQLLDRLVDIRSAEVDDLSGIGSDTAYATAFREARIDPDSLDPGTSAERIKSRPPATAAPIAMALDDWAVVRRDLRLDAAGAKRVAAVARLADPDPWRNRLRDALEISDKPARRAALAALAASVKDQSLPPVSFDLLGRALSDLGAKAEAESILHRGRRAYPNDLWLNYDLAGVLDTLGRREEAIRYYTAARILRPESAHELAHALQYVGEVEDAIGVFRDLARLRPRNGRHLSCLGHALQQRGAAAEARAALTAAVTELRQSVAARPDNYVALLNLGNALKNLGRLDESIAMYRKSIEIKPDYIAALENLGISLYLQHKYDEAMTFYREAIRLKPDTVAAYQGLADVLEARGRIDEAIDVIRQALRARPDNASSHLRLGILLVRKGRFEEALMEKEEALRLTPGDPDLLHGLGVVLRGLGRFEESAASFRKSLESNPNNSYPLNAMAWYLLTAPDRRQRRPEEALELSRRAVKAAPDMATYSNTLGLAEYRNGLWDAAIATLKKSIEMNKGNDPSDFLILAMSQWRRGDRVEAERLFQRGVEGVRSSDQSDWEWRMLWAEAADLLGKPRPVPTAHEARAEPDRAMESLRRMVARGDLTVDTLKTSPDLGPLRARPDFAFLILDVMMPHQPFAP